MADSLNTQIPLEFQPELQGINRQQELAKLLLQQGMQQPQGQMISGRYVAPSLTQYLQPLLGAYAGSKGLESVENQQLALAQKIRQGRSAAEEQIINAMTPTPEKVTELAGPAYKGQVPVAYQPAAEPNWAEAARLIRTNQYGAGKELLPQVLKNFAPETPSSVLEYKFAEKNPGYMGYRTTLNKAGAPNMTAITNVANYEPFKNKAQTQMGNALVTNFETLQNIPTTLATLDRAKELAPKSFAGSFGEQKLELTKFFNNNLGTNINPEKVKNTEELRSTLFANVMDNLKKMDASPSQQQQQILQQAMGSLATDPQALPRVINVYREILESKAKEHNRRVKEAETGPAKMEFPYSIYIPIGQETQQTGGWRIK